jgi:hypothetical protein
MNNGVRNTLRALAALLLASVLGITVLLIIGTDRSPLPDRESLLAHIESLPPDQDAFPLWQEIFHDQYDHVDYKVELMLSQHRKWDAEIVRHQAERFADTLSAIHELRKFGRMRSDYVSDSNGYNLYVVEKTASLVIAAGLLDWHEGQRAQASERFRDAAHIASLLYLDGETTLASQRTAMHIVLTLITTMQRPIADSSDPTGLALLELVTADLQGPGPDMQLTAFQNEKSAFLVSLVDQIELPFFQRVTMAAEIYHWSAEYCEQSGVAEQLHCQNRLFDFLAMIFPRFYTHWQPLNAFLDARHQQASHLLELPCAALPITSANEIPSPHWSDYLTSDSSLARIEHDDDVYQRLVINQCLADFFVSSQQIATRLKAYELEAGKAADSLDAVMQDTPKDPFGTEAIHYDVTEQLLWSAGINGDADKGYPGAPAPLSYSSTNIMSSHPTYLLNPGPIPEPEESRSRCKQDPDIAPLEPLEEQTEDEQAEAI